MPTTSAPHPQVAAAGAVVAHSRTIATWLFGVCAMIVVMVVLGGVTRLTHSGLSIVEWKPVTGWLPPMTDAAWQELFDKYRLTPEYLKINAGMTVDEFKGIFWLEFIHRVWGRLIGLAFIVPFLFFLVRGWLDRQLVPTLVILFVLGAVQGVLGWYMVKSGLVDEPDVSQYRLTAHLGLALVIFVVMFRVGLRLWTGTFRARPRMGTPLLGFSRGLGVLVFVTILSGGFVAGLDAGFIYNTFPLMDGQLVPDDIFPAGVGLIAAFEDVMTVQFNHRVLAVVTLLLVVLFWIRCRRQAPGRKTVIAANVLLGAAVLQVVLGISTLLLVVPVSLAALHQLGAVVLLTAVLHAIHAIETAAPADG